MEDLTTKLILEKMTNLAEKTETGFTGIHRRLDITNNRMSKGESRSDENKESIVVLEKADIKLCEKLKHTRLFWMTMSALFSISLGLGGFIVGKFLR